MERKWFSYQWRVRYAETDQMGVVYHANYANWFEIGRTELIRELGMSYKEIEQRGLLLPLTHLEIQFLHPARYDDLVEICTSIASYTPVKLSFDVMVKLDGRTLVQGNTQHVWVNRDFKPVRLNKELPELYELLTGR